MTEPVITVVGSFLVGMTLRTSHMPVFGETLIGSDFDMGPGGKGSNQAVGVARLGADACFAGIIGADKLGEIATDLYAAEGVNTQYLRQSHHVPTGAGFIILNHAGENGIIIDIGSNRLVDAAFVDSVEAQIAASQVVMSVLELPVEAAARAMELGRKHGVTTILNPAPAQPLDPGIFQFIDILTPNETELRILLGLSPTDPTPTPELARQLQAYGVGTLVVTMGERGAMILAGDAATHVPGLPVDTVDTTGAGDAFNAGLAVALAEGRPLPEAVRYANCAGAIACTQLGVIPALGHRPQVDALFGRHLA
ncbi:MAG: ribokinase [Anaerolineae bacterium]